MTVHDTSDSEELLRLLSSPSRTKFLVRLMWELTLAGRDSYVEAGVELDDSQRSLRCLNELQTVVVKQVTAAVSEAKPAYPDAAFLDVLTGKAVAGDCQGRWAVAVRRAAEHELGQDNVQD